MGSVQERIREFIKYKGISIRDFERLCGLSNSYINNIKATILPDKLEKIALQCPDLSLGWLLSGEGHMIKGKNTPDDSETVEISAQAWKVIQDQAASLCTKDQQIGELINMMKQTLGLITEKNESKVAI